MSIYPDRLLRYAQHASEFVPDIHGLGKRGPYWHTLCGEDALATACAAVRGVALTPAFIDQIAEDIVRNGWGVDPIGATLVRSLATWATVQAPPYTIFYRHDEDDAWSEDEWRPLLFANAGIRPIVLFLAHGNQNVDVKTGTPPEARNLAYHVIAIVGAESRGFIVNDGDHPNSTNDFQVYSLESLRAAQPRGMLILDMETASDSPAPVSSPSPPVGQTPMEISEPPPGWERINNDDQRWLSPPSNPSDPNSTRYEVAHGILSVMKSAYIEGAVAIEPIRDLGNGNYEQMFQICKYIYRENGPSGLDWVGYETLYLRSQVQDLQDRLTKTQAQLQQLQQQPPPPPPTPAPTTPVSVTVDTQTLTAAVADALAHVTLTITPK